MKHAGKRTTFFVCLLVCLCLFFSTVPPVYAFADSDETAASEILSENGAAKPDLPEVSAEDCAADTTPQAVASATATEGDAVPNSSETEISFKTDELPAALTTTDSQPTASEEPQTASETVEPIITENPTVETAETAEATKADLPVASEAPARAMVGAVSANPEEEFEFERTTGTVTGYLGTAKDVVIPSEIGGVTVRRIGDLAFSLKELRRVTIPNTVTSIGTKAFFSTGLNTVTLSTSLTSIGDWAFAFNQLSKIALPDTMKTIGEYEFIKNQLTAVTIPRNMNSIGRGAFSTNQLNNISISASVRLIGEAAFAYNQLTAVTLPNVAVSIDQDAFKGNQLTAFLLPGSLPQIHDLAFDNSVTVNSSPSYKLVVARAGFAEAVDAGTPVTLAQRAEGGAGASTYRFSVIRSDGTKIVFGGYSGRNIYTWTPVIPDTYDVLFEAKDAAGNTSKTTRSIKINSNHKIVVARAGFKNPVEAGTPVVLAQRAEGGIGACTYKFWVRGSDGDITKLCDYSGKNTYTWTPVVPDDYTVIFWAKDGAGKVDRVERTIQVLPDSYHIAVARAGFKNPVDARTPVVLAQRAEGGVGLSKYRFSVIRSNGKKVPFGTYSGRNIYRWVPITPDTYTVVFEAMDAAGHTAQTTRSLTVR